MTTKTIADKLLIRPDTTVWTSHAGHLGLIGPLPDSVTVVSTPELATTAIVFAEDSGSLREILEAHKDHLATPAILWVAYPKANRIDINRDTLWPILGEYGLRPITQVAIDDVWSALRFRPLKEGEAQFTGGTSRAS